MVVSEWEGGGAVCDWLSVWNLPRTHAAPPHRGEGLQKDIARGLAPDEKDFKRTHARALSQMRRTSKGHSQGPCLRCLGFQKGTTRALVQMRRSSTIQYIARALV